MQSQPFYPYEQSLLLVIILFSRQNLKEFLEFFPEQKANQMEKISKKFLSLSTKERVNLGLSELRRLLLLRENSLAMVHESWIKNALNKEPKYIRNALEKDKLVKKIFFLNNQQKILFEPLNLRIQAMARDEKKKDLHSLSGMVLSILRKFCVNKRFNRYLEKHNININKFPLNEYEGKVFSNDIIRSMALKIIIKNITKPGDLFNYLALFLIALYCYSFSNSTKMAIIHSFSMDNGLFIIDIIKELSKNNIDNKETANSSLLISQVISMHESNSYQVSP